MSAEPQATENPVAAEPLAGDQDGARLSAVALETARERKAQGLPPKITDERALAQVARLVNEPSRPPAREVRREPDPKEGTRASRRTA